MIPFPHPRTPPPPSPFLPPLKQRNVHDAAAPYYDPEKAVFKDFLPFWEFVSGPLHAGNFGPNGTDNTFGIQVKFQTAGKDVKGNRPPSDGHQYFGGVKIDAATRKITVTERNREGRVVYSVTLDPEERTAD